MIITVAAFVSGVVAGAKYGAQIYAFAAKAKVLVSQAVAWVKSKVHSN